MKFLSQCEAVIQDPFMFWISVVNPASERIQKDLINGEVPIKFVKLATRHMGMVPFPPLSSPVPVSDTLWFRHDFGQMLERVLRKAAPDDRVGSVSHRDARRGGGS